MRVREQNTQKLGEKCDQTFPQKIEMRSKIENC